MQSMYLVSCFQGFANSNSVACERSCMCLRDRLPKIFLEYIPWIELLGHRARVPSNSLDIAKLLSKAVVPLFSPTKYR